MEVVTRQGQRFDFVDALNIVMDVENPFIKFEILQETPRGYSPITATVLTEYIEQSNGSWQIFILSAIPITGKLLTWS